MKLLSTCSNHIFFTAVSGVGSNPILLVGMSGDFPGVLPFRPTYRLAHLVMSEIILKGMFN